MHSAFSPSAFSHSAFSHSAFSHSAFSHSAFFITARGRPRARGPFGVFLSQRPGMVRRAARLSGRYPWAENIRCLVFGVPDSLYSIVCGRALSRRGVATLEQSLSRMYVSKGCLLDIRYPKFPTNNHCVPGASPAPRPEVRKKLGLRPSEWDARAAPFDCSTQSALHQF
jgi:hypothetical protein